MEIVEALPYWASSLSIHRYPLVPDTWYFLSSLTLHKVPPPYLTGHEASSPADMSHVGNGFGTVRGYVHATLGDVLGLAEIVELEVLVREEFFENVRMLKLRPNSTPVTIAASNIYGIIDETKLLVGCFMFELISIPLSELNDEIDYVVRSIWES